MRHASLLVIACALTPAATAGAERLAAVREAARATQPATVALSTSSSSSSRGSSCDEGSPGPGELLDAFSRLSFPGRETRGAAADAEAKASRPAADDESGFSLGA